MVAFHDRRAITYDSIDAITPGLPLGPGDSLSKSVKRGRFVVRGEKTEEGRDYVIHEALPDGRTVERGRYESRQRANRALEGLAPTQTYDIF